MFVTYSWNISEYSISNDIIPKWKPREMERKNTSNSEFSDLKKTHQFTFTDRPIWNEQRYSLKICISSKKKKCVNYSAFVQINLNSECELKWKMKHWNKMLFGKLEFSIAFLLKATKKELWRKITITVCVYQT